MDVYFWLYLIGAAVLIGGAPVVLLLLWKISAQLQALLEQGAARDRDRV